MTCCYIYIKREGKFSVPCVPFAVLGDIVLVLAGITIYCLRPLSANRISRIVRKNFQRNKCDAFDTKKQKKHLSILHVWHVRIGHRPVAPSALWPVTVYSLGLRR